MRRALRVHGGLDPRATRAEGVESLRARPLPVFLLQIAGGDVADARVAKHVIHRIRATHATSHTTDHDPQLGFMLDTRALGGKLDDTAVAHQRASWLQEEQRLGRHLVTHLSGVRRVVSADAQESCTGRLARGGQPRETQRRARTRRRPATAPATTPWRDLRQPWRRPLRHHVGQREPCEPHGRALRRT